MHIIVEYYPNIIKDLEELLGYTPITYTFSEIFQEYCKTLKKSQKGLATPEVFSLQYDSLLSDLKKSVWVTISKNEVSLINKKLNILEICD